MSEEKHSTATAAADTAPDDIGATPQQVDFMHIRLPLPARNWGWFMARGLLLVVLGLLAAFAPGIALFSFALLFAVYSFVDGILAIVSAIRGAAHGGERWGALILVGLAGIAIGILFVLFPVLSTITYALMAVMLVAAWAVIRGIFEIMAAIRLRREIKGEWLLGLSGAASLILGLGIVMLAFINPSLTILSLGWVIAIYALLAGIALVALALRLRSRSKA